MSKRKISGICLIALPFVLLGMGITYYVGYLAFLTIFGLTAAVVVSITAGVLLLGGK